MKQKLLILLLLFAGWVQGQILTFEPKEIFVNVSGELDNYFSKRIEGIYVEAINNSKKHLWVEPILPKDVYKETSKVDSGSRKNINLSINLESPSHFKNTDYVSWSEYVHFKILQGNKTYFDSIKVNHIYNTPLVAKFDKTSICIDSLVEQKYQILKNSDSQHFSEGYYSGCEMNFELISRYKIVAKQPVAMPLKATAWYDGGKIFWFDGGRQRVKYNEIMLPNMKGMIKLQPRMCKYMNFTCRGVLVICPETGVYFDAVLFKVYSNFKIPK